MRVRVALALLVTVAAIAPLQSQSSRPAVTAPAQASAPTQAPIRAGLLVRPDTVTVGDPFTLVVTVEVPVAATVQWPVIGDTAAPVAMRSPVKVTSTVTGTTRRETAEYALAAWDVGVLSLGVPDATVRLTDGVVAVPLRDARIVVKTVLPLDTSLHVPKPPRPLFPRVVPWWEAWWPAAAAVAALALLWWLFRRRRRRVVPRVATPLDVFARAMHDFDRLERLALADVGERGRAVALAVEIVRTYLSVRMPAAALSLTSDEVLTAIVDDARVPRDRLASLLGEADSVKFARRPLSASRACELHAESRALVQAIEAAEVARRQHDEDVRLARQQAEREARQRDEDEARRRSRRPKAGAA